MARKPITRPIAPKEPREHVTLVLRPDQIVRLPRQRRSRGVRLVELLGKGLELRWEVCSACGQEIRPHDNGPYKRVSVRIPADLARRIRIFRIGSSITPSALYRELIDRAMTAEIRPTKT